LAADLLEPKSKSAAEWRKLGFTTVQSIPNDGIFRGRATLLNLGDAKLQDEMLIPESAACMGLRKGSSTQKYPSSAMGVIALIRQTLLDVQWYDSARTYRKAHPYAPRMETNLALESISEDQSQGRPFVLETRNWQEVLRLAAVSKEFEQPLIYKTGGDSYKRLDAIRALNAPLIVPLTFPKGWDVTDVADARQLSLGKLRHWEAAPSNPGQIARAGIPFALTSQGLHKPGAFWKAVHEAVRNGLHPDTALAALTLSPATLLGKEKRLGSLTPGKIANFLVCEQPLFQSPKAQIRETWVAGRRYAHAHLPDRDPRGRYSLNAGTDSYLLLIGGALHQLNARVVTTAGDSVKAKLSLNGRDLTLTFPATKGNPNAKIRLRGLVGDDVLNGRGSLPDGQPITWSAKYAGPWPEGAPKPPKPLQAADPPPPTRFPNKAYGLAAPLEAQTVLIQHATVWTNTAQGILEDADVIIADGKVQDVGRGLRVPPGAVIVDGTGKHVTPGIIDEHSHIALSSVNEGTHAVTAEVRMGDVIDAEDVNIYRQLAGGVTMAQLLHGSANPIGGQSAIVKFRWGSLPEEMKYERAAPFIKFALGENVKHSNAGDHNRVRYPQTRLGVEQTFVDAFHAAMDYNQRLQAQEDPVRRDLQLEALLEIVKSQRFITCHS
ncbi:MAG: amidohydrolase family protein, partial [Bacteroidota bacterium]